MSTRSISPSSVIALVLAVSVGALWSHRAGAQSAAVPDHVGRPGHAQIVAALLEGWSQTSASSGLVPELSGPGLVRQLTPATGTLLVRGPTAGEFLYDGNLSVVNLGDSTVDFTLTDGTVLMTVPPGGSSTVRPFLALPPNEVGYTSRDGLRTEFVWVIRKN